MRRATLFLALMTVSLAGCGDSDSSAPKLLKSGDPAVTVRQAWVRLAPVEGRPAAAYFTLRSRGSTKLDGITSPSVGRIELHDMVMDGNVMRMTAIEALDLPEGEAIAFAPGGKHAMLFDLQRDVHAGRDIALTFIFQGAPPVTVQAPVRPAGDPGPFQLRKAVKAVGEQVARPVKAVVEPVKEVTGVGD